MSLLSPLALLTCPRHFLTAVIFGQNETLLTCLLHEIPSFNIEGSKTAAFSRQHGEHGMVDILIWRCSHDLCSKQPSFDVEGSKTPAFCKKHAEDDIVNIRANHSLHVSCTKNPSFNFEGSKTRAYCKQHAEDGMVDVVTRRCSHDS